MNDELMKRLNEINNEDIILGVFVFLIVLTYIANQAERNYFVNGVEEDKYKYYYLMVFVFFMVVLINIYFVVISYKEVVSLQNEQYSNKVKYANLTFIASIVALVAGLIILYIAITDRNIDAEISL